VHYNALDVLLVEGIACNNASIHNPS